MSNGMEGMIKARLPKKLVVAKVALNNMGYTDSELVREGLRCIARREKVAA